MITLKIAFGEEIHSVDFEHSLVAVSKWESKHKRAFLGTSEKTPEEMLDYYGFMILDPKVDRNLVYALTPSQMTDLIDYMADSQTATVMNMPPKPSGKPETMTSDLIYYWMVGMKINWEAQHWHINRLMMLIQIVNIKQSPPKKQSVEKTMEDWDKINERQKKLLNTEG